VGRGGERNRQSRGPLIPPWLVVGAVLVVVVVVLYIVGTGNKSKSPTTPTTTATNTRRHHRHRSQASRTPAKPQAVKLELVPTGQVYVCLTNGSGKQLIPGQIFNSGQTIPVETGSKLLLTLGNNSVKMRVNGANVSVAPSSSSIGYELVPGSTKPLPTSQQPRCA
jgi:cytoskeleton protein RodZ